MIPNKYVLFAGLLTLFFAGCAPSLRSPSSRPDTTDMQQEGQTPGAYGSSASDRQARRTPARLESNQLSPDSNVQTLDDKMCFIAPSTKFVNDRLIEYQKKLDRWRDIDGQAASLNLNREDTEKMSRCLGDIQKNNEWIWPYARSFSAN